MGRQPVTKAALCVQCSDIVAPRRAWRTDRSWRWCECGQAGVRWRDGNAGLIEVTARYGPENVRVIGLNNVFLAMAVNDFNDAGRGRTDEQWRTLHTFTAEQAGPGYLFHRSHRDCWALVVRPGESGDVTFVPYLTAKKCPAPGSSADRAPAS
jgi:hypothetical protein